MIIDPFSDGHIHTRFCNHAVGEMEEYVLAAIDKGLQRIFFLEHMEEGIRTDNVTWLSDTEFDRYFELGQQLQQKYSDKISIGLGVEVGYNPAYKETLLERLHKRKWDRVGISYHFYESEDYDQHLNLVSKKDTRIFNLSLEEKISIERKYYKILAEAVNFLPGTVLCHLDAVLRHHPSAPTTLLHLPLIDALLDCVKENQMALEINTSGMNIRKDFFPTKEVIALAKEKGIPLSAGSDAHRPEDVGRHFSGLANTIG